MPGVAVSPMGSGSVAPAKSQALPPSTSATSWGALSWYFDGSHCCQMSGGSRMCVSAETIRYDVMAPLPTSALAREAVELARVVLTDRLRVGIRYVDEEVGEDLAAVRPVGVVVREVALPHQLVDADHVPGVDGDLVADDAGPELALVDLGRLLVLLHTLVPRPRPRVVEPLDRPRHPAGAALGQRELHVRRVLECFGQEELTQGQLRVDAAQRDPHRRRSRGRRARERARRTDVHRHDDLVRVALLEER